MFKQSRLRQAGHRTINVGGIATKHTFVLEPQPDGGYVVTVPDLPGCISQGDTREEAVANITEAIKLYLNDCGDAGDPIPTEDP